MNESKSSRHQRRRRRGRAVAVVLSAGTLGLVAFTPIAGVLAAWSGHVTSVMPGWIRPVAHLALFTSAVLLTMELVALPARLAAGRRIRVSGGSSLQTVRHAFVAELQAFVGVVVSVLFAAGAVQVSVWAAGSWWWILAGFVMAAGLLVAAHAAPAVVAVLSGAEPIQSPSLGTQLAALSHRAGVPVGQVYEVPVQDDDQTTAFIAGLGHGRRIFLASTLVREWREDEVAVVVAHELGHHRRGDLWRTLALDAGVLVAGLGVSNLLHGSTLAAGQLAPLPMVAWTAGAVWILAAPLRLAQSRHHERLADRFALQVTGGAEAFSTVVRRLGARHLADEEPSALARWFTYRHPTVAERLAAAATHRNAAGLFPQ